MLRPLSALRYVTRHTGPAIDRHIDVSRIDVEAAKAASDPLGSNERRARAEEEVKNDVATTLEEMVMAQGLGDSLKAA